MEEWKIYRLGDLVDFQNGYAFKSSKFLYDGKYKIIRIKELKNGLVKFSKTLYPFPTNQTRFCLKYWSTRGMLYSH